MGAEDLNKHGDFCELKRDIIIVDDDVDALTLLSASFKEKYKVHCLESHRDLIKLSERIRPVLILLDINMPHIDGYEILNLLHNNPVTIDIPVICMSADKSLETRQKIKEFGGIGFLSKPIQRKRLQHDIDEYINSLNVDIQSQNNKYRFIVTYNSGLKNEYLNNIIFDGSGSEKKVVCSWVDGDDFFNSHEKNELIDDEKIYYLEFKPAMIIKFPYLQDLSPIFHEIETLIGENGKAEHIILDEPRNFLNVYGDERVLAQSMNFFNLLKAKFKKITIINSRPHAKQADAFLQKLGKILVND